MTHDISDFLSYEIRKELADRYFGFRKLIEDDKTMLADRVKEYAITVEQKICFDLVRIYILLHSEELVHAFFQLTGLDEGIFFDPYLLKSPTIREKVFYGIRTRGITQEGRFKNLLLDSYEDLERHVSQYREKIADLLDQAETINEEIKLFYKKNDICSILGFLRGLNHPACANSGMDLMPESGSQSHLENKLQIEPPEPVESLLTIIPPITPLPRIRRQLKKLAEQAYDINGKTILAAIKQL